MTSGVSNSPVALVQLCDGKTCVLLRLRVGGEQRRAPTSLIRILGADTPKVGSNIAHDITLLRKAMQIVSQDNVVVSGIVDLKELGQQKLDATTGSWRFP